MTPLFEALHTTRSPPPPELFHLPSPLLIVEEEGQWIPFSPMRLTRRLALCLPLEEATATAMDFRLSLGENPTGHLTRAQLRDTVARFLARAKGAAVAQRYLSWLDFMATGRPFFLLIGGVSGTGKSLFAGRIASTLGVAMVQSTDMVREVLRAMDAEQREPDLHLSSFEADTGPNAHPEGYLRQTRRIAPAVDRLLHRASREGISMILEGVHLHPGHAYHRAALPDALLIHLIMSVRDPALLRSHLETRGKTAPGRAPERYLHAFPRILSLQAHLLREAEAHAVPVIENGDLATTTACILELLGNRVILAMAPASP